MAAPKYLSGDSVVLVAPAGGTVYGVPQIIEDMLVLPATTESAGDSVVCDVNGVWEAVAVAGEAWTAAQKVYYDRGAAAFTTTAAGNMLAGYAAAAKASAATTGYVLVAPEQAKGDGKSGLVMLSYDFAVDGGAIGSLYSDDVLPDNAVVIRTSYEVLTTCTSATDAGTGALGIETDDVAGLLAATAISAGGNVFDAGFHDGIQDGAAANFATKTAAAGRRLQFDIAVEAFTAGKFVVWAEYVVTG